MILDPSTMQKAGIMHSIRILILLILLFIKLLLEDAFKYKLEYQQYSRTDNLNRYRKNRYRQLDAKLIENNKLKNGQLTAERFLEIVSYHLKHY